jgi:hypothetical protein
MRSRRLHSAHEVKDSLFTVWQYEDAAGRPYFRLQVDDIMVSPVFWSAEAALEMIRQFEE